jgi:hypothetical protein
MMDQKKRAPPQRSQSYTAGRATKGGPFDVPPRRVWTPTEQLERLSGYLSVEPAHWPLIRYGTHMRYYLKTGEYRSGGFVLKNPSILTPRGAGGPKRYFRLRNGFDAKAPGYAQWVAAYEDVARVYIKPDVGVLIALGSLEAAVEGLNKNIRKLATHAKELEARLTRLEAHQTRLERR